jgi:hypothetical protein
MLKVRTSVMNGTFNKAMPPRSIGHVVRFEMRRNHPQVMDGLSYGASDARPGVKLLCAHRRTSVSSGAGSG